jgi:hypothetical protein
LLTLGAEECLSFASTLGVIDLTLPALDNEPCDGTVSHPLLVYFSGISSSRDSYKYSQIGLLLNIYL